MQRQWLLSIVLFAVPLSGSLWAQNTFPATGNVGIGTTNPAYGLHIKNTGYAWLGIDSGPNTSSVLAFVVNGTSRWCF